MPDDSDDDYGIEELDATGRRTGRLWLSGSKWGLECGSPGREPNFERWDVRSIRSRDSVGPASSKDRQRFGL